MHRAFPAALAALTMLATGCATTQPVDPRVELIRSAASVCEIVHIGYDTAKDGSRKVAVSVRNRKSDYRTIRYKVRWFRNGVEQQSLLSGWRTLPLDANEVAEISETAPNAAYDSFRLQIAGD